MGYFSTYKGLPRSIYILFLAQIINRFGDFVLPFLTLLLVKKMGLSFEVAGFAVMCATLSGIPGAFAGGKLADQFGRKKTYGLFQGMAAVVLFICGFAIHMPYVVIVLVCLSAFFNGGVRPCLTAMITDLLPAENRQIGFSLSYLGINLGVAFGPMAAGFLFNHSYQWIFFGDAITSILAVTLMMTQIKETLPSETEESHKTPISEQSETGSVFHVLFRRPQILIFLLINAIISGVYTQHSFSLPLMSEHVFGKAGPQYFGYIMSLNAVTVLVMTATVARYTHKYHPLTNIGMATLTYAFGFGMIGLSHSLWQFFLSAILWTIGEIMIVTNFNVYIANNTPQNFRARFNAVTSLSWSLGAVVGTYGVGKYMDLLGLEAVWPLTFVAASLASIFIFMLRISDKKKAQTQA